MAHPESRRGRRRRLTRTVAARRRALHLMWIHSEDTVGCACEVADTLFADQLTFCKVGRKRWPGQPRRGRCCGFDGRRRIYRWRAQRRALRHLIVNQGVDAEEDAAMLLAQGVVRHW